MMINKLFDTFTNAAWKLAGLLAQQWQRALRTTHSLRRIPQPVTESIPELTPQTQLPTPETDEACDDYERKYNRAHRRALERARRRHDKFVTPKGELPERKSRQPRQTEAAKSPTPPEPELPPNFKPDLHDIFHKQHEVSGIDVLYHASELYGEFAFRDTILDQLDRYWVYLRRMKRHDAEAYKFYRQLGAHIIPYAATDLEYFDGKPFNRDDRVRDLEAYKKQIVLPASFLRNRPAFGCIAYGASPAHERIEREARMQEGRPQGRMWTPKFLYFLKYAANGQPKCIRDGDVVQPRKGGDIYEVTVWWDKPWEKHMKAGVPERFAVFVAMDGGVQVLRMLHSACQYVEPKRKHNGHKDYIQTRIPQRRWIYPFEDWSAQYSLTPEVHLAHMFCTTAADIERAAHTSVIRVEIAKDDMIAVFGVDIKRTAYFFKDRDIVVSKDGTRKRVFHMVRPHQREDGSAVKLHFRGERKFTWAGYDVNITVPGRDHFDHYDMNIGAFDESRLSNKRDAIYSDEFAGDLARQIHEGRGGTHSALSLDLSSDERKKRRKDDDIRRTSQIGEAT